MNDTLICNVVIFTDNESIRLKDGFVELKSNGKWGKVCYDSNDVMYHSETYDYLCMMAKYHG